MKIKDMFLSNTPVISMEVFPPKKNSSVDTVLSTIDVLSNLNPDFISVTYGAGGGTQDRTLEIASLIKNKYHIEALAHLTCITSTKAEIQSILKALKENNIENILSLRGDLPQDPNFKFPSPLHYEYASDLIADVKKTTDFCIGSACYPEGHIESNNISNDLINLKNKISSGSDFLISQLFFDNTYFYNFLYNLEKMDVHIPVSAGIMPVINKKQIEHITNLCGTRLTDKFKKILSRYENNPEALKEAGIAYATEQIIDLLSSGVDGIHIYTMNKPDVAEKIVNNIACIRHAVS